MSKEKMAKTERFICTKSEHFGKRGYAPGEYLEVEAGVEVPAGFMPTVLEGPAGTIQTGPFYFCLKECSRNSRTYFPGELWDRPTFKDKAPAGLFAPLEDRDKYEFIQVSNDPRGELRRKPAPVEKET